MNQLNQRYAELCRDLGHLEASRLQIEERIAKVHAEIRALDNFGAFLKKNIKEEPKKELKNDQPQSK